MRQNKTANITLPVATFRGVIAGFGTILILLAIVAIFITMGKVPERLMQTLVAACALIGSMVGGFIAANGFARRRFLVGGGVGLAMFLICCIISAISKSSDFPSAPHMILLIVLIAGGVTGGILSAR